MNDNLQTIPKGPGDGLNFKRSSQKFICSGVELNSPVNLQPPGKFPVLENVRQFQTGRIDSRPGQIKQNVTVLTDLNIHSIARMNDYINNAFVRYLGAGTNIYFGTVAANSYSQINTFTASGDPLSVVPYRPDQSSVVWAYIADKLGMFKSRSDGLVFGMGVVPPIKEASAELLQPQYNQTPATNDAAVWGSQGVSSVPTITNRLTGVTIGAILYISGSSGWCCIAPTGTDASQITAGMRAHIAGAEFSVVEEVHFVNAGQSLVTISSIIYDVGTTGLCTISPSVSLKGINRNAMLQLGGAEYVRVLSVTYAPDGTLSFRCSTTSTRAAGNTIVTPANGNLWLYTTGTRSVGNTINGNVITFQMVTGGAATPGEGLIYHNFLTPLNWGNQNGRMFAPDDYIHVSMFIDNPQLLTEGHFILDVDPGTTNAFSADDGNKNAYYQNFRSSDFQPVSSGTQTADAAKSTAIQLDLQNQTATPTYASPGYYRNSEVWPMGAPGSPTNPTYAAPVPSIPTTNPSAPSAPPAPATAQLGAGLSQYTEFIWKLSSFTRIGVLQSVDLSTIRAIQFRFSVAGVVNIKLGDMWIGGSYGPDTETNLAPFIYRYRYRSSQTGAHSLPGPMMRTGVVSKRQGISLNLQASSEVQVDKIDIERLGGNNTTWNYIGTCDNSTHTYTDSNYSSAVVVNPPLDVDAFQPFPISDQPRTVNVSIAGTAITRNGGDLFNVNWSRGSAVIVNGITTTLWASPTSPNLLHVTDTVGHANGITMEIQEATIAGQPLPVMWGPFYDTFFAAGNIDDPGSVYFTKQFDPDSAPDSNRIEVTSPSETMMNGCLYDGRCYSFSDKRLFSVIPSTSLQAQVEGLQTAASFQFNEVMNGKGLFSKWWFCVGDQIYFGSNDGIYATNGGAPVYISDDIRPLFPQGDATVGVEVNGFLPVDMTKSLRLCYHQSYLIFDYTDTGNNLRTLVYDTRTKGWFPDNYGRKVSNHYDESGLNPTEEHNLLEGGNNGFLYQSGGTSDDGDNISGTVWVPANDIGDTRAKKLFGDIVFDIEPGTATIKATPSINNYQTDLTFKNYTGPGRFITDPLDLGTTPGLGVFAQNLGVKLTWSSATATPKLYYWEPSMLERPEDTFLRADDWTNCGTNSAKLIRGFLVEADTENGTKDFKLQGDQADIQAYTITANGQLMQAFPVTPPIPASLFRLVPTEAIMWRKFQVSYIYDEYPELQVISTPYDDGGFPGAKLVRGLLMEAATPLGVATVDVERDGDVLQTSFVTSHTSAQTLSSVPYAFRPPFVAHLLRLTPLQKMRVGKLKWVYDDMPEQYAAYTDYVDEGYPGAKFVQGLLIDGVTTAPVSGQIQYDGDQNGPIIQISQPGTFQYEVPYSFQPFIAHKMRVIPSGAVRLGKIKWVWEPSPELATTWVTQATTFDFLGFSFLKDGYIAAISTAPITLQINVDGRNFVFTIPSSGGQYLKFYLIFGNGATPTIKGKWFTFSLTSSLPFRLFKKDCQVNVHSWYGGGLVTKNPFGDISRESGARI